MEGRLKVQTLIVVNGEQYWQEYFPGYHVHYTRLQTGKWLYYEDKTYLPLIVNIHKAPGGRAAPVFSLITNH